MFMLYVNRLYMDKKINWHRFSGLDIDSISSLAISLLSLQPSSPYVDCYAATEYSHVAFSFLIDLKLNSNLSFWS